jgi:hypothetical protein
VLSTRCREFRESGRPGAEAELVVLAFSQEMQDVVFQALKRVVYQRKVVCRCPHQQQLKGQLNLAFELKRVSESLIGSS